MFELTYPAPLSYRVHSREACTYLYRAMNLCGWIPPERGVKRYACLLWACLVFAISGTYVPIGFLLNLIIDFRNLTPGDVLNILQTFVNAVGAMLKCLCGIVLLSRQHETKLQMDELQKRVLTDIDRQKIHDAVAVCNKIFLIYGICYFAYTISGVVAGVITGRPPWMIYNPFFNWRNGNLHFYLQLALEYICGSMTVLIDLVWDSYTLIYITIFRAHIDILKEHIKKLRTDPLKTESENYDELVHCIGEHKLILEYVDIHAYKPLTINSFFQSDAAI